MKSQQSNKHSDYTNVKITSQELEQLLHHDKNVIETILDKAGISQQIPKRQISRPPVYWNHVILWFIAILFPVLGCIWVWLTVSFPLLFKIFLTGILLFIVWKALSHFALQLIILYQHYAPEEVRNRCKCYPSCSEYAKQAIQKYGFAKGLILGYRRFCRCGSIVRGNEPLL